jgi:hypothetical protein
VPEFNDLALSLEQVCFVVTKARQINVKDVVTEPDPGSNPTDDGEAAVLEDHSNDASESELEGLIHVLNVDERLDLVTLAYIGRDDADLNEWNEMRAEAAQAIGSSVSRLLLDMPLLSDYLEDALAKFGVSCLDLEQDRL